LETRLVWRRHGFRLSRTAIRRHLFLFTSSMALLREVSFFLVFLLQLQFCSFGIVEFEN
jgi:hypothetical protein